MMTKYIISLLLVALIVALLSPELVSARRRQRKVPKIVGRPVRQPRVVEVTEIEVDDVEAEAIHQHAVRVALTNVSRQGLTSHRLPFRLDMDDCPITNADDAFKIVWNCARDLISPSKYSISRPHGVRPVKGHRCSKDELDDLEECALEQNITMPTRVCLEEWDDVGYNALCEAFKAAKIITQCILEEVDFSGRLSPETVVSRICDARERVQQCVRDEDVFSPAVSTRLRERSERVCEDYVEAQHRAIGRSQNLAEIDEEEEEDLHSHSVGLALAGLHQNHGQAQASRPKVKILDLDSCPINNLPDLLAITMQCGRELIGPMKYSLRRPLGVTPVPGARCSKVELDDLEECALDLPISNQTRECLDDWDDVAYNALCEGYKAIPVIKDCVVDNVDFSGKVSTKMLINRICNKAPEIEECVHEEGSFAPATALRVRHNFEELCRSLQAIVNDRPRDIPRIPRARKIGPSHRRLG